METSAVTTSNCVDELQRLGHVRLDSEGNIIGAAGLSLTPTVHELSIGGKKFWAWCAFDVIGIFGALRVSGFLQSLDPFNNETIRLEFIDGTPNDLNIIVFMADLQKGSPVCDCSCSNINFFASVQAAEAWSQANKASGSSISVGNLVPVATEVWSRFVP
jgi:hypothetical protein